MIVQEMDARSQLGVVDGLYGQALIASIQKELQEYKRYVFRQFNKECTANPFLNSLFL